MRFQKDINSFEEGKQYYLNRAVQLLKHNYFLMKIEELQYGVMAVFIDENHKEYYSLFIYQKHYGLGLYDQFMTMFGKPTILTSDDCNLKGFLEYKGYEFIEEKFNECDYYNFIFLYYGDKKAERSGVYYMNHIDEGLAILKWLQLASPTTCAAYALHPVLQMDPDLTYFVDYNIRSEYFVKADPLILIYLMEYRSVANEYLSKRKIESLDDIRLSPLKAVNDMLIADKIQNRKDFELYHNGLEGKEKHPRAEILEEYFKNWLVKLNVNEYDYQLIKNRLVINPKIITLL